MPGFTVVFLTSPILMDICVYMCVCVFTTLQADLSFE
jgi:hypothetical protein